MPLWRVVSGIPAGCLGGGMGARSQIRNARACTTHFVGPINVVNGPIAKRIGMKRRERAGQGNRANSTIGCAPQLVIRNVGAAARAR